MKTCSKCRQPKPLSAFHTDRSRPRGVTAQCRTCRQAKAHERYYADIEASRARARIKNPRRPMSKETITAIKNLTIQVGDCWLWTKNKSHGYGYVKLGKKCVLLHRHVYTLAYGDIPKGYIICHKCNNRSCVNPEHLYAGTYKDNYDDMVRAGNAHDISNIRPTPRRGKLASMAILDETQVLEIFRRIQKGESFRSLAIEFGVGKTTISNIGSGRNWGWLTKDS